MDLSLATLTIGFAVLIVAAALVIAPLLAPRSPAVLPPTRLDFLEHERVEVLRAIRELDDENRAGKLPEDDYRRHRRAHVERGAAILREIETLAPAASVDPVSDEIERRVAELVRARGVRRSDTAKSV